MDSREAYKILSDIVYPWHRSAWNSKNAYGRSKYRKRFRSRPYERLDELEAFRRGTLMGFISKDGKKVNDVSLFDKKLSEQEIKVIASNIDSEWGFYSFTEHPLLQSDTDKGE